MSDRGTGITTRQIRGAPREAVFVWCNGDVRYPQALAKTLGRSDLVVRPLSWLQPGNVMGRTFTGVVVDHAAEIGDNERETLDYLRLRRVPVAT
jgi:hypothetical protein